MGALEVDGGAVGLVDAAVRGPVGGHFTWRVEDGGPALKAGVRVGDRIRAVNGLEVNSVDDAQRSIYGATVGDKLRLTIDRGGHDLNLSLTLGEAPGRAP